MPLVTLDRVSMAFEKKRPPLTPRSPALSNSARIAAPVKLSDNTIRFSIVIL